VLIAPFGICRQQYRRDDILDWLAVGAKLMCTTANHMHNSHMPNVGQAEQGVK